MALNGHSAESLKVGQVVHNGVPYYKANDVAILLGYSNYSKAVSQNVPKEYTVVGRDIGVFGNQDDMATKYITREGVAGLVFHLRLPNSIGIASRLGIPLSPKFKKHFHEMDTIDTIMKVFRGEKMLRQYWVGQRRIDLHLPEHNIALECDENDHKDRDPVDEAERLSFIDSAIEPQWVRYNPTPDAFDIVRVLGDIYALIHSSPRS